MPIGKHLKKNIKISNAKKEQQEIFQNNLRIFQQNHRESEYNSYQRELEVLVKN